MELFWRVCIFLLNVCSIVMVCTWTDGQTSSGKTHTMEGPNLRDPVLKGVIPRTVDKLFQLISQADPTVEFYVTASYFEICKHFL